MANPATYENLRQISFSNGFNYRRGALTQDAYIKNGLLEVDAGEVTVQKRPGLKVEIDFATQTGYFPALGTPLANYVVQGGALWGDVRAMVIADRALAFSGGSFPGVPLSCTELTFITGTGNPAGGAYRGLSGANNTLLFQGPVKIIQTNPALSISLPGLAELVPSLCELDLTFYVLDGLGYIWASAMGDHTTWPALNFVQAFSMSPPVVMVKHLQYLVAFSVSEMKLFYDAGISPGAPIAQLTSIVGSVGVPWCGAKTVQSLGDITYWMGQSPAAGLGVYQLSGLTVTKISTPEVDRFLLENFTYYIGEQGHATPMHTTGGLVGVTVQAAGHSLYILTCPSTTFGGYHAGSSVVFDITTQTWAIWTQVETSSGSPREAELLSTLNLGSVNSFPTFMPAGTTGKVLSFDIATYQDAGQVVNFEVQTPLFNWGNQRTKMIPATYVQADTLPSLLSLSWTDDDYVTFTTPRVIVTSLSKKQLLRCGSTVQRAWRLTHTDNTPMRLYGLEVEVIPGAL